MLPVEHLLAVSAERRRELEAQAANARLARLATAGRPSLLAVVRCRTSRRLDGVRRAVLSALHRPVPARCTTASSSCCPSPA